MNVYDFHKANPDIFKQLILKDQLFLFYKCPQREHILQAYSNFNSLAFTINGKRIFRHGNKTWVTNKERGFLMKRGAFLQELPPENIEWEVLVMYLKDNYLKNTFEEFRPYLKIERLPDMNPHMIQEIYINDQIRNCYESILPYFRQPHLLPDPIFEGKFKELLFNILAHPSNKQVLAYVNQIIGGYLVPIWEIMESNYMFNLSIADFAKIANRSTATFRREFEEYYRTTPGKWLKMKRLEKAALLLKTSDKTISEIVFECGFKNISHFSRVFSEKFKLSPSKYRIMND